MLFYEDDPVKNTALKMIRAGIAMRVSRRALKHSLLILNPYSLEYLGPWHRDIVEKYGLLVVDASWHKLSPSKFRSLKGTHVKLPPLIPGNPINYGKTCILSSIEAVAAALFILGFKSEYEKLLGLYKWMKTFNDLNKELLEAYSKTRSQSELVEIIKTFWKIENPCYIFKESI
jgi:pre-rRNA-processing protein TSR3